MPCTEGPWASRGIDSRQSDIGGEQIRLYAVRWLILHCFRGLGPSLPAGDCGGEQPGAGTLISGAADTSSTVLHLFPRCCVCSSRPRNAAEPFGSGGTETAVKAAEAPG